MVSTVNLHHYIEVFECLVWSFSISPDAHDDLGQSPMHSAAQEGRVAIFELYASLPGGRETLRRRLRQQDKKGRTVGMMYNRGSDWSTLYNCT